MAKNAHNDKVLFLAQIAASVLPFSHTTGLENRGFGTGSKLRRKPSRLEKCVSFHTARARLGVCAKLKPARFTYLKLRPGFTPIFFIKILDNHFHFLRSEV